jgi:acetylornithine deacetylase/succinyl-diaminopimelate desuccinylase-like protein
MSDESVHLLQQLIKAKCVNDGTVESGQEVHAADILEGYLGSTGLDIERFEPQPGRTSLVARIEGSDPDAPSLLLMGHTDVVPVNEEGWSREAHSGDLVDGFVWGRGAVDMLNLTATQAVAFRRLAASGFTPKGTLIYLAVADEEALGTWGAKHLVEHERDAVYADYVLTESGGYHCRRPPAPGAHVGEGHVLVEATDPRHTGSRVPAVPHRQRGGHRVGDCAPAPRVPA